MILYGLALSSPCNKVRFLLHALDIPYDFQIVNPLSGEGQSPAHLQRHPAGKIPVLDDDGFLLFESNAILRYLANKTETSFYPANPQARALVDQWLDFASIYIGDGMARVFYNRRLAPMLNREPNEALIADGLTTLDRFLPPFDQQLSKQAYLAGAGLTIADFNLLAILDPAEVAQIDLTPYPSLQQWRDGLRTRDFYTRCHKSYADAVAAMKAKT
ncbi:MAG: glutathione S-transferase family protein [Methylococcaceae bacterium]|nr:MAG: glutathione S-transferase family protein [Methylococcaceae bacterium]